MKRAGLLVSLILSTQIGSICQSQVCAAQPALPAAKQASVDISRARGGDIPPTFTGVKFARSEFGKGTPVFSIGNTRMVGNLRALSPVPGQSCLLSIGADGTKWVANGAPHTPGQVSEKDIDALAAFLIAAHCKLDYTAELLNNTPASAAEELAYVSRSVGRNLLAVGFGNEPDGANYNGIGAAQYEAEWHKFAAAALAKTPALKFKGPEAGVATHLGSWVAAWYDSNSTLPLAYASQHYYVSGPRGCAGCTAATMLTKRTRETYWNTMVQQKASFEAGLKKPLPVVLTETNNFYSGGAPGVSNSYASALYAYDFALQAAQAGFSGVAFASDDGYSKGYSPIFLVNGYDYGPKPEYYGIYMAALMGYGPMLSTSAGDADAIHAYSVRDSQRSELSTALINTSAENYQVNLSLPQGMQVTSCVAYALTDSRGLADTTMEGISIQGAKFDNSSQISLGDPYCVAAKGDAAKVGVPADSGLLLQCRIQR